MAQTLCEVIEFWAYMGLLAFAVKRQISLWKDIKRDKKYV